MTEVPNQIIPGTRILLVGEAPGETEVSERRPFAGAAGDELNKQLRDAGLHRGDVSVANVLRFRPPDNDEEAFATANKAKAKRLGLEYDPRHRLFLAPWAAGHIERLREEIERLQPHVIVPMGNLALRATTGETGILNWRGSIMASRWLRADGQPFKVIPVVHPAAIFRQYSWRINSVFDFVRVRRESATPEIPPQNWVLTPAPAWHEAVAFLDGIERRLAEGEVRLSVDIETARRQITCIGFATSPLRAMCFPLIDPRKQGCSYWPETDELELVLRFRRVLHHPNCVVIGQNFAYDKQYIARQWGIWPRRILDTGVGHHTLWLATPKKLGFLSSWYCQHHRYWKDEGKGKEEKKEWGSRVDPLTLWTYNLKDCCVTFEVWDEVEKLLRQRGLWQQFEFEMALERPVSRRCLAGVRIDAARKRRFKRELEAERDRMQAELNELVGHELSPRKPHQLKAFFYDDLRLPKVYDKKTGRPTTNEDALKQLAAKQPLVRPICDRISNIRSCGLFISNILGCETPGDRLHTSYDIAGTVSLRFASRKDPYGLGTNLQNIPKGLGKVAKFLRGKPTMPISEIAKAFNVPLLPGWELSIGGQSPQAKFWRNIEFEQDNGLIAVYGSPPNVRVGYQLWLPPVKEMILPDPGYRIAEYDLSRADIYVMAWDAEAKALKQMLRERVDLHTENAKTLDATRDQAKIAAHAFDYLASNAAVARNAGVTVHKADQMRKRWFGAHPEIPRWHKRVERELRASGGARNKFGFQVVYFDRLERMLPEALAWICSSTVSVVINKALLAVDATPGLDWLMQTHDSLALQSQLPEPEADALVRQAFDIVVPYEDPLVIPVEGHWSSNNLGECKEG